MPDLVWTLPATHPLRRAENPPPRYSGSSQPVAPLPLEVPKGVLPEGDPNAVSDRTRWIDRMFYTYNADGKRFTYLVRTFVSDGTWIKYRIEDNGYWNPIQHYIVHTP